MRSISVIGEIPPGEYSAHIRALSLVCRGDLSAPAITVTGGARITGTLRVRQATVFGALSTGKLVSEGSVEVRGLLRVSEFAKVGNLSVVGRVLVGNSLLAKDIEVQGHVEVGASISCRELSVAGSLSAREVIADCLIQVRGRCEARRVRSGRLWLSGVAMCEKIEVSGDAELSGSLRCSTLTAGGILIVRLPSEAEGEVGLLESGTAVIVESEGGVLRVSVVRAPDVRLDRVIADEVRGEKVILKCSRVGRVVYGRELVVDDKSTVEESLRE